LKANLPCRVSFKLPSIHDSKTVLKESGAENLLGRGDMLVQAVGEEKMFRAHAPFVDMNTLGAILANTEGVRQTLTMVGLVEAQTALETPVA
jgi:S-DNA-T family DNA segregation ATPase FtsK/SpoIIIE